MASLSIAHPNGLIAALDKITNFRKGENGHTEYQWATDMQEKIVQFHFQLVRADKFKMDELAKKFHEMLRELGFIRETVPENDRIDMICSLYCMLGQTRDIVAGKGEYALSYMMLYELYIYYPEMTDYALEQFVLSDTFNTGFPQEILGVESRKRFLASPERRCKIEGLSGPPIESRSIGAYGSQPDTPTGCLGDSVRFTSNDTMNVDKHPYGSWKDLKYLAAYCKQKSRRNDHGLIKKCIELTNQQLRKDMDCAEDAELSLCAKWVPREGSQFGWFFHLLAKDFYKGTGYLDTAQDSAALIKAEKKCYMEYRRVISGLNKRIDTVQIKQCGRIWTDIDHNKTTSITLSRNKKAFLNLNKKGEQRSELTDRIDCADNFKKYLADQKSKGKEVKGKRVGMEEFTRQAIELIQYGTAHHCLSVSQDECDILNSQWRDNSKQTGALHKMIAMVDTSGSMAGDPLNAAIALGIRVAEKSVLGKRILTFSDVPTWHDLRGFDTFVDMVRETMKASWKMNTNFYAALNLILDTMISNEVPPEDVDGLVLAVFSDMQIDQADSTYNKISNGSLQQEIERKYLDAGYKCPHILFWNLRSTDGFPSLSNVKGASMLSGFSPALLNLFCEKGVEALESLTPRSMMMESLAHPRYARMDQFARKFLS